MDSAPGAAYLSGRFGLKCVGLRADPPASRGPSIPGAIVLLSFCPSIRPAFVGKRGSEAALAEARRTRVDFYQLRLFCF